MKHDLTGQARLSPSSVSSRMGFAKTHFELHKKTMVLGHQDQQHDLQNTNLNVHDKQNQTHTRATHHVLQRIDSLEPGDVLTVIMLLEVLTGFWFLEQHYFDSSFSTFLLAVSSGILSKIWGLE